MPPEIRPFHLAIPVTDIEATRKFYIGILGCTVGREAEHWIDFNFYGHQVSAHLITDSVEQIPVNLVDGESVPVRHFGLILEWEEWHTLAESLKKQPIDFIIEPTMRFKDKTGEQATLFIKDPSGNALEFKTFKDNSRIFMK